MVVREDDRRRIARQRLLDHLPRVHARAVDGAAEQLVERDEAVPVVQVQAAEDLVRAIAQLRDEEAARRLRRLQRGAGTQRFGVVPPG
jgi:hypothetical protein